MKTPLAALLACALLAAALTFAPAGAALAQSTPLPTCTLQEVQSAFANVPAYVPSGTPGWVGAEGNQLVVEGQPFLMQGVNYYPMHSPWRRFLTESNLSEVDAEMTLLAGVGFNTIRIYLWNEALFQCPGSGAVPQPSAFARLDGIVRSAAAHGLRVVMTLNDMPDLETVPLYTSPGSVQAQTAFIVGRYRDESAVLAWDLRNAGDIDYGSETNFEGPFTREEVLAWLDATRTLVRGVDPRHLITAGWAYDVEATIPYVDYVSFAHWNESGAALQDRVNSIARQTTKPIVLAAFGLSTFERSEDEQASVLTHLVEAADAADMAGWLVWTAFDFPTDATCVPPNCPSQDNREHHFGLWRTDYSPKPALDAIAAG